MIDTDAMPTVADIPRVQSQRLGDAVCFSFEGRDTTFNQLEDRSSRIAGGLSGLAGVQDRIAWLGQNMDAYYEILFGAAKARMAMTGVNTRLAAPEVQYILHNAEAPVLFVTAPFYQMIEGLRDELPHLKTIVAVDGGHGEWPAYADWLAACEAPAQLPEQRGHDDVIQLYTSGTTGHPKGVQLSNDNYTAFFRQAGLLDWAGYETGEVVMNAMPLFHVAGVNVGLLAAAQGARTVILREIDPAKILDLVESEKVNHAFWVPAVILMLTQIPGVESRDFSSLKMVSYGASPIAEDLLVRVRDLMGCRFTQLYGLTETVGAGTFLPPEAHAPEWNKLRACGVPWPGALVRCVDGDGQPVAAGEVGEIVIQAGFVMKGYWKNPEATAKAIRNGFFHTGDAGYFDEDGFVYIHDRVKDMIVSGGENVYPAEVENALFGHPEVADVAVIGVPDEKWGEAVKAIVVPAPGASPDPDALIAHARERIAGYKLPKSVDFAEELPRNPSGKILRKDLREPYWRGVERRVG